MTMQYKVMVAADGFDSESLKKIEKCIEDTFSEVNQIYNKWNPDSEISKLNLLKAGEKIPLSQKLYKLLVLTDTVHTLTNGKFDPTIEPLQSLWKQNLLNNQIPTQQELDRLKSALGWSKIHFDSTFFWKDHSLTSLDLGGIAKGYCIDLLTERISDLGYQDIYVEWGGEIRTLGSHPANRPWRIFISGLDSSDPAKAVKVLDLCNESIATSGDYLQYWNFKNQSGQETKFFHIFNLETLSPLQQDTKRIASASVCAESCALADGLATAAMMFDDIEKAQDWLHGLKQMNPHLKFWLYTRQHHMLESHQ